MTPLFKFFKKSDNVELEAEFKKLYQEPGVRFLAIAQAVGGLTFLGYYFIDAARGSLPLIGGAQTMRLYTSALLLLCICATLKFQDAVAKHYTVITNVYAILAFEIGCLVSYTAHLHDSATDALWGFNTTLVSAVVLMFGFSRLTALNTAVVAWFGVLSGVSLALSMPAVTLSSIGRLLVNLLIVNVAAFSLRNAIESRERQLFMLAKDNLQKNIYAKELETAKVAAEEADAAKTRFLNNMSHEMRTPMSAVLQILDVVSQDASPQHRDLLERGRTSGEALLRLLNGILDYVKSSHGETELTPSSVDPHELFRGFAEVCPYKVNSQNVSVKINIDIAQGGPRFMIDEARLLEIIDRLMSNAVKFTERGFIVLRAWIAQDTSKIPPASTLHITVRDTGIGMSESFHSKVFSPFFQLDSGPSRKFGGAGLGLAVVKSWVDLLNGKVELTSVKGIGTEVHVALPIDLSTPTTS